MKQTLLTLIFLSIIFSCSESSQNDKSIDAASLQSLSEAAEKVKVEENKVEVKELDRYDFVDFTENYEGEILTWKMDISESIKNDYDDDMINNPYYDFKNETLRDYVGKSVGFKSYGTPVIYMSIFIPEDLAVPKATYGNTLMVKFKCGGDLKKGNTAISITRPR